DHHRASNARPALRRQAVHDAGHIAVGDEQKARKIAHRHAFRATIKSRKHIEAGQGGIELRLQPAPQLRLNRAAGAQQPYPKPQSFLAAHFDMQSRKRGAHHVSPPDSEIACPVTEAAPSPTSHMTVAATSSGWMKRPCGLAVIRLWRASSWLRPVLAMMRRTDSSRRSVSTKPGQTALTVTPVLASSTASARIRPTTPCFEAT